MMEVYSKLITDKIDQSFINSELSKQDLTKQKIEVYLRLFIIHSIIFLAPVMPIVLLRACEPYVFQELDI